MPLFLVVPKLFENPPTDTVFTQTDYFIDRPPTPEFVPAKTGVDTSTQIYPGELFHFDTEVKPILEVLVGKTIEQALVEVMEEDELLAIREQQRRFREIRDAELAEQGRLEEEEKRKRKEMVWHTIVDSMSIISVMYYEYKYYEYYKTMHEFRR